MPLPSLDPLRGKIKDLRRDRRFAAGRKRLMKQYGFTILPYDDEPAEHRDAISRIAQWHASGDLHGFAALYEEAERADQMLCNGQKLHAFLWSVLRSSAEGADPADCDGLCKPFERWWESARTPLSAAAFAAAVHHAAYAHRGTSFAEAVTDAQWAAFNARLDIGREVLAASALQGERCMPWCWMHYDYGLQDADGFEEFQRRFQRVWNFDTSNAMLCRTHGVRLLPRWFGEDARDLEAFARHAASVTQDRYGAGMYALVYAQGYHVGAHEIGDTLCDVELMKRGFEDLAERHPSQSLFNRWAAGMYFAKQYRSCERVFRTRIKAIVPEVWLGKDRDAKVKDALDTFVAVET